MPYYRKRDQEPSLDLSGSVSAEEINSVRSIDKDELIKMLEHLARRAPTFSPIRFKAIERLMVIRGWVEGAGSKTGAHSSQNPYHSEGQGVAQLIRSITETRARAIDSMNEYLIDEEAKERSEAEFSLSSLGEEDPLDG